MARLLPTDVFGTWYYTHSNAKKLLCFSPIHAKVLVVQHQFASGGTGGWFGGAGSERPPRGAISRAEPPAVDHGCCLRPTSPAASLP